MFVSMKWKKINTFRNWEKINKFRRLMRLSLRKTIFLNFSLLPFWQAIKLPIICTRYTYFYSMSGRIVLTEPARFGMIRLGYFGEDVVTPRDARTLLQIEGTWETAGNVHLGLGVVMRIERGATFATETNVRISNRTKIICYDNIRVGHDTRIAWECQLIDTTFHYMRNIADGSVTELNKPIRVGAHNWIGNRANIMKGAYLPDYTIVAAGSLCNKHYDFPEKSMIAGSPAKLVKTGIYRCLDDEEGEIMALKARKLATCGGG